MKGRLIMLTLLLTAFVLVAPSTLYPAYTGGRARHWERTVVRDADGVRAGAQPFAVGEGEITLLMVHGFASSPAVFQRMAPALAERGYRCRVMRLPGFGEAAGSSNHNLQAWRAAVEAEVQTLQATSSKVWLVGHSMGATLALDYVVRGGSVDGLILVTPLIDVSRARSVLLPPRRWFELGQKLWRETDLIETAFPVDLHEPMPGLDELRDLYLPVAAYREMFAVVDQVAGRASAVRCPTLVAVAPGDLVVDSLAATAYYSNLGVAHKRLFTAQNSGHVLPLDRDWRDLVAAVDQFVRE
jgi:carboxylesterase